MDSSFEVLKLHYRQGYDVQLCFVFDIGLSVFQDVFVLLMFLDLQSDLIGDRYLCVRI